MACTAMLQPQALHEGRIGVGACLWDASFVLTSFLGAHIPPVQPLVQHVLVCVQSSHNLRAAGTQEPLMWAGARVVELGAGLGLPGLFLVQQGAKVRGHMCALHLAVHPVGQCLTNVVLGAVQVTFTDRAPVLPLLRENVARNTREVQGGARCAVCMSPATPPVRARLQPMCFADASHQPPPADLSSPAKSTLQLLMWVHDTVG